ncbi:MAG: TIGR04282 family arsenosugar biosynthesis glycosyltransferase [Gammaproteobacteria bacterium]|nr:TIGR04282 family arsenosugar biosynthesis glycosyltransferase [Gammaproteobacteria bacterium]
MPRRILMVFAKAPVAGYSKTRLIPELGADGAANLQKELITRTLVNCVDKKHWQTQLWCAPDCEHDVFSKAKKQYDAELYAQCSGDLGQRMQTAFEYNLSNAETQPCHVVIVGTDCPAMNAARVRQAFAALLAGSDVVINPAEDGGYVLLGMKVVYKQLFDEIPWGSSEVMQQTRRRAKNLRLSVSELAELWDVDEIDDFRRYQALAMV